MARDRISAKWWVVVAALGGLGAAACKHEPDVVANISQIEEAGESGSPAGTAGETAGGAGGASGETGPAGKGGTPGEGSVGSGTAGSGTGGSSEPAPSGIPGSGGGGGDEPGAGGAAEMGTGGTVAVERCELIYRGVAEAVEDECVVEPDNTGAISFILAQIPVAMAMSESQPFSVCQWQGWKIYWDGGRLLLCDDVCDAARKWLDDREQFHGCPSGAPDSANASSGSAGAGSAGAGSAGSGSAGDGSAGTAGNASAGSGS